MTADKPLDVVARALAGCPTDDRWGRTRSRLAAERSIAALTAPKMREALVKVLVPHLRYYNDAERVADAVMAWLRGKG